MSNGAGFTTRNKRKYHKTSLNKFLKSAMNSPNEKSSVNRSYYDHKISSTRSEGHIKLVKPLLIPKRSLSSATLYNNDEQVSEITSTNELNKEYPTCTDFMKRLEIQNINYKPVVLLQCIDEDLKRRRQLVSMKCAHCPKVFTNYDKLQRHLRIHDEPTRRIFPCLEASCHQTFRCKYKLKSHARAHHNLSICKTCNKEFNFGLTEFQWHESICRGQEVNNDSNARVTRSKALLLLHQEAIEAVEQMYEARIQLWQRPDAEEYDTDPEEQRLSNRIHRNKLEKKRRYSKSASVFADDSTDYMDDTDYIDDIDLDRQTEYNDCTSVVSKSSKTSKYSQISTKSKPISISIRSNYSHISRNEYSHMNDASLVKVRENFVKHRRRTRSISMSLAKVELELVCRSQRQHTREITETGVEIKNQIKKRMLRLSKHERNYSCEENACERSFGSLNEIMKHEQESHNYLPMFRCVICRACFTKKIYLMKHRNEQHQEIVNCPICLDVCSSMEERKTHMDLHLVVTFICAFCDMGFVKESLLAKHEYDVHGIFSKEIKMDVIARKILKGRPQNIEIISRHFYTNKITKHKTKKALKFPAAGYNIIRKQLTCKQYYPNNYSKKMQPSQLFDAKLHDEKNDDSSDSFIDLTKDAPNFLVNYDKFPSDSGLISPETVISHEGDKYDDFEVPKPSNDTKVNFQPDDLFNYLMLTQFTNTG